MIDVKFELEPVPEVKKFMAKYDRYEPVSKGSSVMKVAMTCLRMYFYEIVLARKGKNQAAYFGWGSAYHVYRYVLEKEYGYGDNTPPKYDEAKAKQAYVKAAEAGLKYWRDNGITPGPEDKFAFMTQAKLLKTFMAAFRHWEKEKLQGRIKVLAIEQGFNLQLPDGRYTSGRADQIISWNGKIYGRDFKTSTKKKDFYVRYLEPNDQFTRYTWAEEKLAGVTVHGQFVEVMYNDNATKKEERGPEIYELLTSRTPEQIKAWEREQKFHLDTLDRARVEDNYPMNPINCPFCPFHIVCQKPTEGSMMAALEASFIVRPRDNLEIEGVE